MRFRREGEGRGPVTNLSRDRWLALADPTGGVTVYSPRAEAGSATWKGRAGDERIGEDLAGVERLGVFSRRSSWHFDGGDFVADGQTVFVATSVGRRNIQRTVADREELLRGLETVLGKRVVLLEETPDHHAGMFMMTAGEGRVLVGDPSLARGFDLPKLPGGADFGTDTQRRFDAVAEQAAKCGYQVVRAPVVPSADGRTWLTCLNVIINVREGKRVVYMPVYQDAETLNAAGQRIWESLGYEVRPVDCTTSFRLGGSLRCLVNVLKRVPNPG